VLVAEFGAGAVDALQEDFGSGPAHFAQGLANGGQGGILEAAL